MSALGGKRTLRMLLGPDRITAAPQRQRSSAHIPLVRPHALKAPEPLKRGEDVDSAISRVSAPACSASTSVSR
jgi:hypothetical protein